MNVRVDLWLGKKQRWTSLAAARSSSEDESESGPADEETRAQPRGRGNGWRPAGGGRRVGGSRGPPTSLRLVLPPECWVRWAGEAQQRSCQP